MASNRGLLGQLANIFFSKEINYLTNRLEDKLNSFEWLNGIWFSPDGIRDIVETLNGINKNRHNKLDFFITTYRLKRENYFCKLIKSITIIERGNIEKLENVRGLIFDIQKKNYCN